MKSKSLVWFTNNLRVNDNGVLQIAINDSKNIIGVYFFNPDHYKRTSFGFKKTEKYRAKFLIETVQNLENNLKRLNIPLLIILGKPEDHIQDIVKEHKIDKIFYLKEWTQEEIDIIKNVKKKVSTEIEWKSVYDQFLYHPEEIPFEISEIPKVFTVFRKKIEKFASVRPLKNPSKLSPDNYLETHSKIPSIYDLGFQEFEIDNRSAFPFIGGENTALDRLNYYIWERRHISNYKETRNGLVGLNYSSKLSAWLANGSVSSRTIYHQVKKFESKHGSNQSTYWLYFELIWRDFFKYISLKHGNSIFKLEGILNKEYNWDNNSEKIKNWIEGNTSHPFVNANMIELKQTGWMSNRGRQNVGSYFSKTLNLDWRIGAAYFESLLIDYDVHSNYGNWMYVSGVGNDPRDRVFNITLQAERYDPNKVYQNQWLKTTVNS